MENNKTHKYVGFKNTSKNYGDYEVTKYLGKGRYEVVFDDGFKTDAATKEVINGKIKNKNRPHVCGVGYQGVGVYGPTHKINGIKKNTPSYEVWRGMVRRCYDKNYPRYKDK